MFREVNKQDSFAEREVSLRKFWDKEKVFEKSLDKGKDDSEFIFFDGPPFATGLPHYGHLLAGTIKDIIPRYWTMKGKKVERRFGWDCHGLPIESLIQNDLNLKGIKEITDFGVDKFNEACRESVLTYVNEWKTTVNKMGRWVDFENDYKTMDMDFMESVWWVFSECFKKGLIYQGHKIQPYSPALATPLSNFETNQGYRDRQDPSITVTLPLLEEEGSLLIWTTTPWTLPSNMAVAVGPNVEYVKIKVEDDIFWLAKSRVGAYFKEGYEVLDEKQGSELTGKKYAPLFDYVPVQSENQYKILKADYVTTEDGTGLVHIAPSFGEEDFNLGQEYNLGLFDPLDAQGEFTDQVPDWQGVGAKDADKSIIQKIKSKGRMFRHETLVHSYPHCYRTDVPLLYRALKTWFLSLEEEIESAEGEKKSLKDWMIDCNQQINWIPEHIKNGRFGKWLEGARDWNLSRNRFWGTPIPIWMAEDGDMICVGSVAELENLTNAKVSDIHKHFVDDLVIRTHDKQTYAEDGKQYFRTPEVLDCWFESGSMPYAQKHYPFENKENFEARFPADFIAEGLDQTRGWFYTLTVLSAALWQKPAFKNVIINGIILAENGQKMSKRLKNYPDPNELIDSSSADAIRLFMINSAAVKAGDLKFSENGVREMTRSILLPLWNALSLFVTYANADSNKGQLSWKPGDELQSTNELDQWILSDLQELLAKIQENMESFRLYNVVPPVLSFIDDLTNWYIRRSRRRFWKSENDEDKNFAYATLHKVLVDFSKVLAPFLPFLAEEIYQRLVAELMDNEPASVHLCEFPLADAQLLNPTLVEKMSLVREAVQLGRVLRAHHNIKNRQPLKSFHLVVRSEKQKGWVESLSSLVQEELNVKELKITLDESSLVKFSAKANFKLLGKRMGKAMGSVAKQISSFSHETVSKILEGETHKLEEGDISAQDIIVVRSVNEGMVVESSDNLTAALDVAITKELMFEGLARECVNKIQNLRKDSGLFVTDKIKLKAFTQSEDLKEMLNFTKDYIQSEVLADSFELESSHPENTEAVELNGEFVSFEVVKQS